MGKPSRVVFDTNVVISGFLTPGSSRNILAFAAQRVLFVFSSPLLEQELADILRGKFKHDRKTVTHELATYRELVHRFVYPNQKLNIIKVDPADNRILEAAVEADVEFIITGDRHLLALGKYKTIKIVRPSDFLLQHFGT